MISQEAGNNYSTLKYGPTNPGLKSMVGFAGTKDVGGAATTLADSASAKKSLRFAPENLPNRQGRRNTENAVTFQAKEHEVSPKRGFGLKEKPRQNVVTTLN